MVSSGDDDGQTDLMKLPKTTTFTWIWNADSNIQSVLVGKAKIYQNTIRERQVLVTT